MPLARVLNVFAGEFRASPLRTAAALLRGKRVLVGRSFTIRGLQRIWLAEGATLRLGVDFFGFASHRDRGLVRIRGSLLVQGAVSFAPGCRVDVGDDSIVTIGDNTYLSPATRLVSQRAITIGRDCAIGWESQLLDDDFHSMSLNGGEYRPSGAEIRLGDHVWVGSRVTILKGSRIADHCVVASGATVLGVFDEPRCLIAGSPARVVRRNVGWGPPL